MSDVEPVLYRRLIIELGHAGADARALRSAAEFARLLGLDLLGVFVEDEAVLTLAEHSFAREIRLPTHEWTPLAGERLAEELRHAADQARQAMQQVVAALGVPNMFEVLRGDPAACIAGLCAAGDIVVVTASGPVFGSVGRRRARHAVPASVLWLPAGLEARTGPVVAVVKDAADPALQVAARAAAESASSLLILLPAGQDAALAACIDRAVGYGVPRARVTARAMAKDGAEAVASALGATPERLIVASRAAADEAAAARIAGERGVPVLLTEPPG